MTETPDDPDRVAARGSYEAALRVLYRDLDAAIAARQPICAVSGRCCRFREYGHTLFLSGPEFAYLLAHAGPPVRALDVGETCPWQDALGRCMAREARPLGCRVYFCDPAFEPHISALSEAFIGRLKRLVDEHGLEWSYAPLHRHLDEAVRAGRFHDAGTAGSGSDRGPVVNPPVTPAEPGTTILT